MHSTAIVTVNYHAETDTAKLLRSLIRSGETPEVVVVDNGSTGDLETCLPAYPFLTLIKSPKNLGFGRGNNLGIQWLLRNSTCKYIFLLNNDTVATPGTIRGLEAELEANETVGIACPRILLMDAPNTLWYGGGEVNWYRGCARIPGFNGPGDTPKALEKREVDFASGCAMMVRRVIFEQIGGFDPRFFMYEEDLEFCLRTQKAGWHIAYCPNFTILHKLHGSQPYRIKQDLLPAGHSKNPNLPFFLFNKISNRLLTMSMHARGSHALQFLLGFPVFFVYDGLRYLKARRFDAIAAMRQAVGNFFIMKKQHYNNELEIELLYDCTIKQRIHTS